MVRTILSTIFLFLLFSGSGSSEQVVIRDYDEARDKFFWNYLYPTGGISVYCGISFGPGQKLTVEHAYPADWMAEARGCPNRNNCPDQLYKHAVADLHNLWPANGRINSSRGDLRFGEIPGENRRRFTQFCQDYERTSGAGATVEPRDAVKGDLARSLLYMAEEYAFPLFGIRPMLLRWHRDDPPDQHEKWRNEVIFRIQGTRNRWIEN